MTNQRKQSREHFLKKCAIDSFQINALAQDASFRRYFRLTDKKNSYILMDAPPEHEPILPFIQIAKHLSRLGLVVPDIYNYDVNDGFILLEDFGDDTYTQLLTQNADEIDLYRMAVATLAKLHHHPQATQLEIPHYNETLLIDEAILFCDWYVKTKTAKSVNCKARAEFIEVWKLIFASLPSPSQTLVLRDFHVDNIIRLKNFDCGLLDFQDAVIGHHSYDLVSLLEDARRDINENLRKSLIQYYFELCPQQNNTQFKRWYEILATQRHLKVLGIFSRLSLRDAKHQYLTHIPRVLGLLKLHLDKKDLLPLNSWLKKHKIELD